MSGASSRRKKSRPGTPLAQRIRNLVDVVPDGCWIFQGTKNDAGYGRIMVGGKKRYAHRVSYETFNGPIDTGLYVCHSCDRPSCVNPDHLWTGTGKDNARDMSRKGRAPSGEWCRGEGNGRAKLSERDVLVIRSSQGTSVRSLATEFGVGQTTIREILSGKRWAHVGC